MADVLCPICGRPNSNHREFCDFCGNPLDGALPVESNQPSPRDELLDKGSSESSDEASRLDDLLQPPIEGLESSRLDNYQDISPLDGDSRLDDYLPVEETPSPEPKSSDASRLDDYLPPEEPVEDTSLDLESLSEDSPDDASRLDEYLPPDEPVEDTSLDLESLSEDSLDDASRLDDYLPPEDLQDQGASDDASRLDDFFKDDPFKSPDPFREPSPSDLEESDPFSLDVDPFREPPVPESQPGAITPGGRGQEPSEEALIAKDDFLSDNPFLEPEEDQLSRPVEPQDSGDWDFLDQKPAPNLPDGDTPGGPIDAGEWDFLDPKPSPEEEVPSRSKDEEEWDFLNLETPEGEPGEQSPPPTAGEDDWGFLDPSPLDEEAEQSLPAGTDTEDWGFLDPGPPGEEDRQSPPAGTDAEDWGFLDPGPADEEAQQSQPQDDSEAGALEDWSFLDPGPAADLPEDDHDVKTHPEEGGEDAGWLDMLQDPGARETKPESPPEPQKPQTDWLDKIKRLNKSSDLVDEDSSFPDWLSVTGKTAELKEEEGLTGEGVEETSSDVPAWLHLEDDDSLNEFLRKKDLTNEEYKPKITTDSLDEDVVASDENSLPADLSDSQQIKFPTWAEDEKKKAQKAKDLEFMAAYEKDKDPGSAGPFEVEDEMFDDLFNEELPGWLTSASTSEIEQTAGTNLTLGELPGWVEAMRPVVESAGVSGLDDDEDYIENYGPLAGIPSVLPAEADLGIDLGKAVQKPLDLLATKDHQDYVNRLKKLIEDESKSKTIQPPARQATQRVLRWLISILMLVAIAGTLIFTGSAEVQAPSAGQIQGTGFSAMYEQIETLVEGQPVLIAYDYQPAAAGELHTAAATVVDHLMEQGTYLSFVSTQPTGPALAEQFLNATQKDHQYIHTQKYINLGYLPGGSAGLLSFMIAPQKIIPLAFDGSNAWDSPPLISVDGIQDFKMILIITDDPNTAKNWIEQVGTRLKDTPLTMVVSAQVEPLIQPYFRTSPRQLSGYVAGIIDSMNYEQLTQRPNLASKLWLPFNVGIVISVGIIFISGLANGILSLFSRHKENLAGDKQ